MVSWANYRLPIIFSVLDEFYLIAEQKRKELVRKA